VPATGLTFSGRGILIVKLLAGLGSWAFCFMSFLVSAMVVDSRQAAHRDTLELDVPARIPP
jgi:hypothetical protein